MKNHLSLMEGRLASVFALGLSLALLLGGCGKQKTQNAGTEDPPASGAPQGNTDGAQPGGLGGLGEKPAAPTPKSPEPSTPKPPSFVSQPDPNEPPALVAVTTDPEAVKELPSNAKYLPADAVIAFSVEPGQLLKKADHAKLMKSKPVAELLEELGNEMITNLLTNPEESGLAMDQPMHLYAQMEMIKDGDEEVPMPRVGIVAGVKDEAKLEKLLDTVLKLTGAPVEITANEEGGYKQIVVPGAPAALGFNKEVMIMAMLPVLGETAGEEPADGGDSDAGDSDNNCDAFMPDGGKMLAEAFGVKESLVADKRSATHLRAEYDLAVWIDYEAVMKIVSIFGGDLFEELGLADLDKYAKDNVHSVHLRFQPGAAEVSWLSYHSPEVMGDLSGSSMPKDMVSILPQGTVAVMTQSLNMAEALKVINDSLKSVLEGPEGELVTEMLQESLEMTLDELFSIPKGDFLLAFTGLEMQNIEDAGPMPMPQFILGMSVANQDNLGKLQAALARQNALMMMNMVGIQVINKPGRFYIASQGHVAAINAGQAANPLGGNTKTMMEKNDFAGVLRFAPISAMMQQLAEGDPDADLAISVLNEFKQASAASSFSKDRQSILMRLDFRDPQTNGLRQLVDVIRRVAQEVDLEDLGGFGGGEVPEGFVVPPAPPALEKKNEGGDTDDK